MLCTAGEVVIGMVGKYIELPDAYKSVNEALKHAGIKNQVKVKIQYVDSQDVESKGTDILKDLDAILVPGGFGDSGRTTRRPSEFPLSPKMDLGGFEPATSTNQTPTPTPTPTSPNHPSRPRLPSCYQPCLRRADSARRLRPATPPADAPAVDWTTAQLAPRAVPRSRSCH